MQDATQILNTLDNTRVTQRDYSDVQWQYVQDQNGGTFSNMVQFNTQILKTYFIDYHNAYIQLPFTVSSGGTAYDGSEAIAFRDSILQLFNQLIVTTDTGMSLLNENVSPFYINSLRLHLEQNTDYFKVMGSQLHMAETIDKWLDVQTPGTINSFVKNGDRLAATWNTNSAAYGTVAVMNDANRYLYGTTGDAGTTLPIVGENKYFNPAFFQRVGIFKNMTTFTSGKYSGIAMIPLALLHDFFRQFNIAVINLGLQFQLYLTQPEGIVQNQQMFMTAAGVNAASIGQPIVSYGIQSDIKQTARLYVRNVKFNAADSIRMNAKLSENFTKSINFISTDYIPDRSSAGTSFGGETAVFFQQEVVSSIVYPLRLWMLCYPDVAVSSDPAAMRWPTSSYPYYLDQANVMINGVPYWKLPLKFPQDHWEMLKDNFPSLNSTVITYNDFIRFGSVMCFDLQRLGLERITSPTEPVSLTVQGTLTKAPGNNYAGSCKVVYLIERMNEITFSFGSQTTSLVVGNISLNNTA